MRCKAIGPHNAGKWLASGSFRDGESVDAPVRQAQRSICTGGRRKGSRQGCLGGDVPARAQAREPA
jgi:hypothetical protein